MLRVPKLVMLSKLLLGVLLALNGLFVVPVLIRQLVLFVRDFKLERRYLRRLRELGQSASQIQCDKLEQLVSDMEREFTRLTESGYLRKPRADPSTISIAKWLDAYATAERQKRATRKPRAGAAKRRRPRR